MFRQRRSSRTRTRYLSVLTAGAVVAAMFVGFSGSSGADVVAVSGNATGFLSSVSLFGGPTTQRGPEGTPGCDPNQPAPGANSTRTEACSVTATLPSTGAALPIRVTDLDGARAVYGPAVVFGGIERDPWNVAPPSGPITVSTQGTSGPNGSVTSSVSIDAMGRGATWVPPGHTMPQPWLGGIGPGPLIAEAVRSSCTASQPDPATGAMTVTGSTTITSGILALSTDSEGGFITAKPMPQSPVPNDGPHRGVLTNVGDSYEVFYNEQDTSVPGSITVTAIHMRLLGPIAVGDLYIGRSKCGLHAVPTSGTSTTAVSPSTSSTSPAVVTSVVTVPAALTAVAPLTDACLALRASQIQLDASIEAARAEIIRSVPPDQRTAMLAALEQTRAQGAADLNRLIAAGCRAPRT